ncbi:MAG: hypothetical protein AAF985_08310 [Bacteroidota bacterium]
MLSPELIAMIKRISWIAMIFMAAALFITTVEKKRSRTVDAVDIRIAALSTGDNLITREDVFVAIERSFGHRVLGLPIGALNVEKVERVLEADPFIRDADVFIDALNTVQIEVSQREPILRVIDQNGLNYYLDHEGKMMPLSPHFTARVLVATGAIPPFDPGYQSRKGNRIKKIYEMCQIILQDELLEVLIGQIDINSKGEISMVPILGNQTIEFGDLVEVSDKIFRLKTFYAEAMPRLGWKKYKTINLKFRNQVVCKKR